MEDTGNQADGGVGGIETVPLTTGLRRREVIRRLCWSPVATGLAACGLPGAEPARQVAVQGTLRVWGAGFAGGNWEDDLGQQVRREYEGRYPGVTVQHLIAAGAAVGGTSPDQKFIAAAAGGDPPDLFSTGDTGTPQGLGADGLVKALNDRMKGSKIARAENFLPFIVEEGSWRGNTYGLYFSLGGYPLDWNKEHYAASGLNPEQAPDTWEDFATAVAKTLRRDGGAIERIGYHPALYSAGLIYWIAWLWALGGKFLSDDGAKPAFNSDAGVKSLEWMLRLSNSQGGFGAITAFQTAAAPQGIGGLFIAGRAALYIESGFLRETIQKERPDLRFGVAHLPKSPTGKRASVRGGAALVLASGAKNPEAAWRFIEHQLSTDTQVRWNDFHNRLPTIKEAGSSPLYLKNDPVRKIQVDVAAYSQRVPTVHPAAGEIRMASDAIVRTVLAGEASTQDALNSAARQVQPILDKWNTK